MKNKETNNGRLSKKVTSKVAFEEMESAVKVTYCFPRSNKVFDTS
jgi:hypothetical protein